jgi:hypothetical protein
MSKMGAQKNVGTIANSTRPNIAIFMSDNKYWIGPRKMSTNPDSRMGHARDLPEVGVNSKYGSIGFNEKTGQLAILEGNALGSQFRLVTWENLSPPQNFETSEEFFTQAGITAPLALTTPWFPTSHEPAYQEDKKRAVVTVCDNGNIVCSKMFPHAGFATFEIVKSGGEYQVPTSDIYWHHWTATYGCEQGAQYGIRHRITLNGKFVIAYAPTYYYGSGIRFSIIRVSDGKVLSNSIHDSSYGFSPIPIRASEFILAWSNNSDGGEGVRHYPLDILPQFETKSSGDTLELGDMIQHTIDSGYYSTNYPIVIPMMGEELEIFKAGEAE